MFGRLVGLLALFLLLPSVSRAGLYYSGEVVAELPSKWTGFLIDHRALRGIAVEKPGNVPASPLRETYLAAAAKFEQAAKARPLTADEAADLGALYVRLGKPVKAVEVLRDAARRFPDDFRIEANLGTAWQVSGDFEAATLAFKQSAKLAPPRFREAEEFHSRLVKARWDEDRWRQAHGERGLPDAPDDLFGVKYVGESGKPEAGKIAAAEAKKLPANAVALVQQLALWMPADGRLLWQLAELANALGDVRTAAAILDGCVTEFNMGSPDLRERRRVYRAAADELAKAENHEAHRGGFRAKSARPLVRTLDESTLPPISDDGPTPLPWAALTATNFDAKNRPLFPKYLDRLDGKPVALTGFMQPVRDEVELTGFLLLEYPVGCWFCETPEPAGMVSVALKKGGRSELKKGLVKVTGTFRLNRDDPEGYLFSVTDARLSEPD